MIPFDEIDSRLTDIKKDRQWLAEVTPYSADYIRTVLAPNSTRRTERVMTILSEAIEKERANQAAEKAKEIDEAAAKREAELKALREGPALVLRPKEEQFHKWEAAALDQRKTLSDWAAWAIDEFIRMEAGKPSSAAPSNVHRFEQPRFHAAAGSGISADVEYVTTDRALGPGRVMVQLHGDSMSPTYPDGSTVVLRLRDSLNRPVLKKGEIYLFDLGGGSTTLKTYASRLATPEEIEEGISYESPVDGKQKVRILVSLNPSFPEIPVREPVDWIAWLDKKDNRKG